MLGGYQVRAGFKRMNQPLVIELLASTLFRVITTDEPVERILRDTADSVNALLREDEMF